MSGMPEDLREQQAEDPDWFRPPTSRERIIAAALFLGFGVFFFLLSVVWRGSWFRWVIIGLGAWSVVYALGHLRQLRRQ
jgi:hypothetical protein